MTTKPLPEDMHRDAIPPSLRSPPVIGEEGKAPSRAQKIPSQAQIYRSDAHDAPRPQPGPQMPIQVGTQGRLPIPVTPFDSYLHDPGACCHPQATIGPLTAENVMDHIIRRLLPETIENGPI